GGGAGVGGAGGGGFVCVASECPGTDETCRWRICDQNACSFANANELTVCTDNGGQVCNASGQCVECVNNNQCTAPDVCSGAQCVPGQCNNGSQDPDETDTDCGGPTCAPCPNGDTCLGATDCQSMYCDGGTCAACLSDANCAAVANSWCNPGINGGTCVDQKPTGSACGRDAECLSDHCSPGDYVCCDAACDGVCEACLVGKTGQPNGTCALVPNQDDPDGECGYEAPSTCGSTGDGCTGTSNGCILYDSSTECAAQTCSSNVETAARDCDGSGTCVAGATTACDPYTCDSGGTACLTSCSGNGQCQNPLVCDSQTSTCISAKGLGETCANDGECASNHCSPDNVCCTEACSGACESCLGADTCGTDGTCAPVVPGTDPDGECSSGVCFGGSCQTGAIAFVTSETYNGNLGGLAGGDAKCQTQANAACLPGTYMAWLSTPAASPSTRFTTQHTVPYRLVDGRILANGWSDLTDGSIDITFDLDEHGAIAPDGNDPCGTAPNEHWKMAWTSTAHDGTFWEFSPGQDNHCNNWSDTSAEGSWGYNDVTNNLWSVGCYGTGGGTCSRTVALYCFQQ
ncbi:MAG: hypothetical protein JRI23_02570, partial [Deltaproteobacteria bacterium]|nr:hypothetical protein [Deltaproteobacteria bacterium]MBW2530379.1 hypothetical protein [Deltaproteobacteria bacterium]